MKRRLIAIITIAAMLITMLPTGMFAADETTTIQVGSMDELNNAYETIEASDQEEATIELTGNITLDSEYFGVKGKHITVVSSGEDSYKISEASGFSDIKLTGDVTFENVNLSSTLFACGNTVEFGEKYTGTGLKLYGGSNEDLDLTTNGDADGSTHIIIRNGKFKSVVGGNKDTFTQGEYHEYADWSDPGENKHTTLKGNVKIDVYGGSFGGSYNIDVGDTCCNTDVTPCQMYGAGLGSDTIGDVTINVYGLDAASKYNDNIVGGGFGMAGGEDDQTLYDDAIKHTGIVYGDVNLNLLGGNIAEFYGGGWHGGSAYKKQSNVSSERAAQRQYHREEVAVVTGDVNIVMGGDMVLCQNQSQAWGGSYASTIEGDVNVTIKDSAKLAAKYSLINDGAPTPNTMGELDGKYAQYYDGMYTGTGWESGFYGAGQYDIIGGSVNINVEGGYIWNLQGTPFTDPFAELPVPKTEIRNGNGDPAGININVSGGMVHDLLGDYEGGKIADGIAVDISGGQIFSLNVYDGRNTSIEEGGKTSVTMSGGTIYNFVGQYSKMANGVTSTVAFEPGESEAINVGYLVGFNSVNVEENANVVIDAVSVMEKFGIEPDEYGADSDVPFYENVYDLNIGNGATLTTCKNTTHLLGDVSNTEGTWIANGKTTIDGDSTNSGQIFFKQPSEIKGNAEWTGSSLLMVPVVQEDKNYDGETNTDIALTVGGLSSGKTDVRTVNADAYTQAVKPAVGDNYVLSTKNDDNPAQGVYLLENTDAVSEGLYLKRVDDVKMDSNNFMWQVAQGEPEEYQVLYSFKCGTKGASLPEAVTKLLPIDSKTYALGDTVTATQPKQLSVEGPKSNSDDTPGVWTFKGYDADSKVVSNDILETGFDGSKYIQFEGTWVWEKKAEEVTVTFDHNDGTGQTEPVTVEKDSTVGDDMPAEPTRDGFTFTGWNTKQDGSGTEFKADTEVTENIIVYAQWECKKSIAVKPADITIYRGGEEGHDGVVNVNKETGEVEVVSSDSLPEPGFLVTLPESLKDKNVTTLTFKEKDGDRTWTFKSYDGKSTEVYRLIPADGQTATRVTFTDGGGNTVVSDEFDVGAAVNTTFTMALYKGEGETAVGDIVVKDGGTTYPVDSNATGTLTVRGTTDQAQLATVKTAITPEKGKAAVEAAADTTYSINGGDVTVANPAGVALLYDAIIDHSGENRTALLQERAESYLAEKEQAPADGNKYAYSFQYMDLVDANNGNAWVKASNAVTVYWPLPEGTTKDTKFTLLHFKDLDRDMSSNQVADKIASSELETLRIKEVTDSHVVFEVQPGEFSPFALVWEEQTTTPAPTEVTVTFKPGDHGDLIGADADGNVSATVASGDNLTDAQIPDVDADHGYYFTGWLGSDGKTYSDEDLLELTITSDMTFTAQYEKKHIPTPPPVGPGDDDDDGDDNEPPILNTQDHFSYVVGYAEDYRTGQPTDNEDLWPVKPQNNITRAEVASIFYRLLKEDVRDENTTDVSNFSDVSSSDWYGTTVATLADMGIVKGYEDGTFRPNAPITRAEFAAIATRFFDETGATYEPGTFTDVTGSEWFAGAIMDAVNLGLIGGYEDGTVRPNNNITRAEACAIVNRTLGRVPDADHLLPEDVMKTWPDNPESAWFYADMQEATNGHEYEWITEDGNKVENWIDLLDKDWNDRSVN